MVETRDQTLACARDYCFNEVSPEPPYWQLEQQFYCSEQCIRMTGKLARISCL